FRCVGELDEIRIVAEQDGNHVQGCKVALLVLIRDIEELALWRLIGIDGADFLERRCLLGRTVGYLEQVISRIHLRLNLDHLAVAGDAVGIHPYEGITLLKDADERVDLLGLERTIKRYFAFGSSLLDESFLPLLRRQIV